MTNRKRLLCSCSSVCDKHYTMFRQAFLRMLPFSGLENKNKYLSSKIDLLFFKIFSIKINKLLHAFEPIVEAILPLWLTYLEDMHSARINSFFRCPKTLTSHFSTGIIRNHSVSNDDLSNRWDETMRNRHVTYREIEATLGILSTLHEHLKKKIWLRWIPHNLSIVKKINQSER